MYPDDELNEAVKLHAEGEESIDDDHEETILNEEDSLEEVYSSYNDEAKPIKEAYRLENARLQKEKNNALNEIKAKSTSKVDLKTNPEYLSLKKKFDEDLASLDANKKAQDEEFAARKKAENDKYNQDVENFKIEENIKYYYQLHNYVKYSQLKRQHKATLKALKAEIKEANDVYNRKVSDLKYEFDLQSGEIAYPGYYDVCKKYDSEIDEKKRNFYMQLSVLQNKYRDEITYHINPKLKRRQELLGNNTDVLLSVRNLKQFFFFGSKINHLKLKAVSNVSFDVKKGECFGIVGESGCGKTTTGRTIIRLYKATSGSVYYKGYRIGAGPRWNKKEIKWSRIRKNKAVLDYGKEERLELSNLSALYKQDVASINQKYSDLIAKETNKDTIAKLKNEKKKELDTRKATYDKERNETQTKYNELIKTEKDKFNQIYETQKKKIKQIKFDESHVPSKLMNEIQMIFQDPVDSLDPRMTIEDIIQEGLIIQGKLNREENHKKVVEMLEKVGLVEEHASRYPHEFSGGQRQRVGIARALVMNPKLLICDEPISALDVSIRAQIINLLNELKEEMGLTLIFIAHDLSVVKYFCDRIAVMYFGKIVELASSDELFKHPLHPYTVSLLSAIPKPNPITEKNRTRILYKPSEVHDYSVDKPTLREVCPGHQVYCNDKEFAEYQKRIQEIDAAGNNN